MGLCTDLLDAESVFIQKMNDIDAQFDAITKVAEDAASAADNEIIAQRTRYALALCLVCLLFCKFGAT